MEFIQRNIGNIIVGIIVFGTILLTAASLVIKKRKGRGGCSCGSCGKCG
ncbi:hypothetical protein AGMMS50230_13690 [Spirochaetia bacterium]|nr:hypothetical protein AGMMS50230_13690 [Spirochaetia bacterium]